MSPEDVKDKLNQADELVIRLLGASEKEPVPRRLWLQKELFQIAKNMPKVEDYLDFQAHYQGPFSETVEAIEERLDTKGLITRDSSSGEIKLTERGEMVDEELQENIPEEVQHLIDDIKEFMNDLTKEELLTYIYYSYPEMTKQSVEKEDLDAKREEVAEQLYNKDKISLEKAAELSGMSLRDFKGYIND